MRWRLRNIATQVLYLSIIRHATKHKSKMHRVLLGGPFLGYGVIIAEPAIVPHLPCLDREFVSNSVPPGYFSSKIKGGRGNALFHEQSSPAGQDFGPLRHTRLQVHRAHMLNNGAPGLLRPEATGNILPAFPGTGINQPAFSITTIVQPPAQVGCHSRIEATQPL